MIVAIQKEKPFLLDRGKGATYSFTQKSVVCSIPRQAVTLYAFCNAPAVFGQNSFIILTQPDCRVKHKK